MSDNYAVSLKRTTALIAALSFTAMLFAINFSAIFSAQASADQLESRSLTLSSSLSGSTTDGDPGTETNGSAAAHTFAFTTSASATSATFQYCTTAVGTCVTPTGLTMDASPDASSGTAAFSGGTITWTDTIASGAESVTFSDITNPTTLGSFFVRITTIDGGNNVDEGTVASAITEGITITSRVAETLGFSTTGEMDTDGIPAPGTTCSPLTGSGAISLGDPQDDYTLNMTETYDAWSAFRVFTNASNGIAVQYEGELLTKGTDNIDAIGATKTATTVGREEFGLAIAMDANGDAGVGDLANITGAADWGTAPGDLNPTTDYNAGDGLIGTAGTTAEFAFAADTPTTIASGNTYVNCTTGAVGYAANVSPLTPSGVYTTTIVYSAVPTY